MNNKRYMDVINKCKKLVISRNKQYGDSVDAIDIHTTIGIVLMKLNRIYGLGEYHAKTEDELQDSINYLVFALEKFYKKEL